MSDFLLSFDLRFTKIVRRSASPGRSALDFGLSFVGEVFVKISFMTACAMLFSTSALAATEKIGVLFSSFGDVDQAEEVEPFVKKTLGDPDVVPVPQFVKPILTRLGWKMSKKDVLAEYEAIGWATHFRESSQKQAQQVASIMRERGYDALGYSGFTMTFPFIAETLGKIQHDNVQRLVIFYQGAQWSRPTSYVVYRETARYLAAHPEWNVRVTMVRSFSDDTRFRNLIIDDIQSRLNTDFLGVSPNDVCIVLPAHGNPTKYNDAGDPAYDQMLGVFAAVRKSFPQYKVFHGFQNHSELPGLTWTQPQMDEVMKSVGKDQCNNVLINGRTSFTIDSLETLYDHAIGEVADLHSVAPHKRVLVEKMFNEELPFSTLMADLAVEAMQGKGALAELR